MFYVCVCVNNDEYIMYISNIYIYHIYTALADPDYQSNKCHYHCCLFFNDRLERKLE